MGQTSPDLLRWPEFGDPGAVPTDMQELATDVQVALNKKAPSTITNLSSQPIAAQANFSAQGQSSTVKLGRLVVTGGWFTRTGVALAVVPGNEYLFATVAAGFRPPDTIHMAGTLQMLNTEPAPDREQTLACQIVIKSNGNLTFVPSVAGTLRAGTDYVAAGGLVWWTP